jgi:hypothetical protein
MCTSSRHRSGRSQGCRDGFGAGPSLGADLDPAVFEILAESPPDLRIVIRDQNPQGRCSHLVAVSPPLIQAGKPLGVTVRSDA